MRLTTAGTENTTNKVNFKELLKTPLMWNLIIAYFCIYAVNWGLVSWIPTYLQKSRLGFNVHWLGANNTCDYNDNWCIW